MVKTTSKNDWETSLLQIRKKEKKIMNKLQDWKERLKKGHMLSVICVLLVIVVALGIILYQKQRQYRQASENSYNMAFYELVDYVQNVENYLAKSLISSTSEARSRNLNPFMERSKSSTKLSSKITN